jgi:hypothetical protein
MNDYQIQPNTRRCSVSGRELRDGEVCFSVLLDEGGRFVRRDYSAEAWPGPPAEAFGFWQGKISTNPTSRRPRIDDEWLLDCFSRLEGQTEPARLNFRYVLALLLMRQRRFRFEETKHEGSQEILLLRCVRTGVRHAVVNPCLTDEEIEAVQEDVFQALGWE